MPIMTLNDWPRESSEQFAEQREHLQYCIFVCHRDFDVGLSSLLIYFYDAVNELFG